jgi:CubicO group peptidase (beta-lactamase class C family)
MAGSLWTTASDYAKVLIKTMADIQTRRDEYLPRVEVNQKIAWTLGWGVDQSLSKPAWFHWGDGPGYKNFAWIEPEKKTALAFFTNGDHGLQTYASAFRRILGEDPLSLSWL